MPGKELEKLEKKVPSQAAVLTWMEYEWNLTGKVPTAASVAKALDTNPRVLEIHLSDPKFVERLKRRGIPVESPDILTPEQLSVANVMLDYTDSRSTAAKLRACGVNSQTWQGWLSNPVFHNYLKNRAEQVLDHVGVSEAHTALMKAVSKGNVQAVKLLYEVTGRHKDSTSLNVEFFLSRVVEIISTHVTDQDTLLAIGADFNRLMENTNAR
jgi:hypothetical protein